MPYDRSRRLTRAEREEIALLYLCGLSMEETGRQTDTHPSTVRKVLEAKGIEIRVSPTRTKSPTCQRGHDMEVHGKTLFRKNKAGEKVPSGRMCMKCHRLRQRKGWKNQG